MGTVFAVIFPEAAAFSGLTNANVTYGGSVTLGGSVGGSNATYPPSGTIITATVNGVSQTGTVYDATGDFSINFNATGLVVAGSPYTITYVMSASGSLLAATNATTTLAVSPAPLAVTASNLTRPYGAANPALTYNYSGFVDGDTSSVVSGSPALACSATTSSPAGLYPITVSLGTLSTANYYFVLVNGTLAVTTSGSFSGLANAHVTYSGSVTLTGTLSGSGPVYPANGTVITALINGVHQTGSVYDATGDFNIDFNAASLSVSNSPYTVNYSSPASGALTAASDTSTTLTINPAPLTVTAGNATRLYGATNPPFTYSCTGFVNGESASVLTGSPVLSCSATANSPAGVYPISVSAGTLADANYDFIYVSGALTVMNAPQLKTLYNFANGFDGSDPDAALVLSGSTLFGTVRYGASDGTGGILFAVQTNGAGFTAVHAFPAASSSLADNSDGANPIGLILSNNTLYGPANNGGANATGTIYAVNTNGSGFTVVHNFAPTSGESYPNSGGSYPNGGLILSGGTFYGTTEWGGPGAGPSSSGTVFSVNADGTGFTLLHDFSGVGSSGQNSDGASPYTGLVFAGGTLMAPLRMEAPAEVGSFSPSAPTAVIILSCTPSLAEQAMGRIQCVN